MAYFVMWALGIVLVVASVLFIWKSFQTLKKSTDFQRSWHRRHPEGVLVMGNKGSIALDIVLAFLLFSFVTQAQLLQDQWQTQPDVLCFFGMGLYCTGRALMHWAQGRLLLGSQGAVWENQEWNYASIQAISLAGSKMEVQYRKEKFLVPKSVGQALEEKREAWKQKKKGKKAF